MENINFYDINGNKIKAEFIFAISVPSLNKTFVAINNGDLVFSQDSIYNNLDILELIKEDGNNYFITVVQENDWDEVKKAITDELLSKIP